MVYIFLDESGDLGFDFSKAKTSRYFLVTMLSTQHKRSIENIIKKIFKSLPEKVRKSHSGVFHCVKEKDETRKKLFELFAATPDKVYSIIVDKRKIHAKLKDEKHILYNLITNVLLDRILSGKYVQDSETVILTASKRETNKNLNENFKTFLENQTAENHTISLQIEIKTPEQEKALQLADALNWAVFQKYENGNNEFYEIFRENIHDEYVFFK